jgi:hypothetical protein
MSKYCRLPNGCIHWNHLLLVFAVLAAVAETVGAAQQTLRIVTYNIDADTNSTQGQMGGPLSGPGIDTVLQAIGNAKLAGNAQPIDVLALQELWFAPFITLQNGNMNGVVDKLNAIYGAGTYAYDPTSDPTTGNQTGNGPNGLVYNTKTVKVLAAAPVGTASGTGAPRAPMRYTLAPVGYDDHSADFTLYVSHTKAGTTTTAPSDYDRRNYEATELRNNAATIGPNAHVIFAGDFNLHGSNETAYQTMVSASLNGGVGQAIDTLNPANNWNTSSGFKSLFTESATSVGSRFDYQFVTAPMINQPGLQLVPNTCTPFGNGGDLYFQSVTNAANSAAFPDLGMAPYTPAYRSSVLTALTTTTDHLPLVADYSFASAIRVPPPLVGDYNGNGIVDATDYSAWRDTLGQVVTAGSGADGDHSGTIDQGDYDTWTMHFGEMTPGGGATSTAAVPEPSAAALLATGVCLLIGYDRRRPLAKVRSSRI